MVDSAERNQRVPSIGDFQENIKAIPLDCSYKLYKCVIVNLGFFTVCYCHVFSIVGFN